MRRFYLVPKIGDGLDPITAWRPKYVAGVLADYRALDYGSEALFLVAADVTPAEHTSLSGNADVIAVPANLDANLTAGAVSTATSTLEAANLPADWVTTALTYRQVLKRVAALILLMQRCQGRFGRLFGGGITLETRINQLTVGVRNNLTAAAQSLGIDVSGITGPMTLRQSLRSLADQLPSLALGGETL